MASYFYNEHFGHGRGKNMAHTKRKKVKTGILKHERSTRALACPAAVPLATTMSWTAASTARTFRTLRARPLTFQAFLHWQNGSEGKKIKNQEAA
uniref:Uncharacterized protein n=1 Tax=Rhipicephalus zambeziensis TaxID=60191 RepID=A0A224YC96_9ACAR